MKTRNPNLFALAIVTGLGVLVLWSLAGCVTSDTTSATTAAADSRHAGKGGAQLWAENCARCHNIRSPSSYSDGEWQIAMHHMRVRANLTAEEHQKILEFLKSAN